MPQTATIDYLVSFAYAAAYPSGMQLYGQPSYFDMKLSGNAYYSGLGAGAYLDTWCLNPDVEIEQTVSLIGNKLVPNGVTYDATLYSSYEIGLLPAGITAQIDEDNLDLVNWVLNQNFTTNPQYNYGEVQAAIWVLLGGQNDGTVDGVYRVSDYETNQGAIDAGAMTATDYGILAAGDVLYDDVYSIVTAAQASGEGFVPNHTQYMGVIVDPTDPSTGVHSQPLITVVKAASLGNKVWLDCNENGVQDPGELPVAGAQVVLIGGGADGSIGQGGDDTTIKTTYTDTDGLYRFDGLMPGAQYQVQFTPLAGYHFTTPNVGANDETDSDAQTAAGTDFGKSQVVTLQAGEYNDTIDAGLVSDCRPVTFDFSGDSCTDGCNGNVRTYTDALTGVSVTARAFSQNKSSGDSGVVWQSAWLGAYAGGLGVTDNSEGSGGNNTHTIDNIYRNNYVVLQFSQEVKIDKAYLGYVVCDSDIQVWIGDSSAPITSLSQSILDGLATETNTTTSSSARWADINAGNLSGNTLIIAADTTDCTPEDRFKLEKLVLCAPDCDTPVAKASIGNFVWEDKDYDGVQDADEAGIAGVTVNLLNGAGTKVLATTKTDASGGYLFKTLDAGDYMIQVVKPSGYYVTKQNQSGDDSRDSDISSSGYTQKYTLAAGEYDDTADAGLFRKACVGDKVWDDMDHDNIQDACEPGIAGIKVTLLDASGSPLVTTTTDQNGNYKFTVNPGTYQLRFDKTNVQHYNYNQWNNMSYWKWAKPNQGADDAKDSDVVGDATATTNVTKTVEPFTLVSGQSDMTRDAGITPIVIDLDGGGIQTVGRSEAGGAFDLFGNGSPVKSGWIASGEGFLAVDHDGNGRVDSISELFGGNAKGAGFARLADYDLNDDGLVNANDAGFGDLRVWRDANGNHQSDDGELISLSEAGVSELLVGFVELPFLDRQGNIHLERSSARMSDGSTVDMTDVYFNVASDDAAAAGIEWSGIDQLLGAQQAAATVDAGWLFV